MSALKELTQTCASLTPVRWSCCQPCNKTRGLLIYFLTSSFFIFPSSFPLDSLSPSILLPPVLFFFLSSSPFLLCPPPFLLFLPFFSFLPVMLMIKPLTWKVWPSVTFSCHPRASPVWRRGWWMKPWLRWRGKRLTHQWEKLEDGEWMHRRVRREGGLSGSCE